MTDGYQVYPLKEKENLTIAGCWVLETPIRTGSARIPKGSQKETVSYIAMKQIQAIYREER